MGFNKVYTRPPLYPKQEAAFFNERRISACEGSTKSGKTVAAMAYLFEKALIEGKKGRVYWWVAPIASQAEIAFRRMQNAIPYPELYTTNKNQMRITLANDAIIEFKTAERPDGLYGEDVFAAVIDEASRVPRDSWHAVRSTLTATRGPVRMVGNVKGKNNWFYEICRMAEDGAPNMFYTKLTAYDAVEAGVIDESEIEDAKRVLPEAIFRELYLCEPSDAHGNPFGEDYIKRQVMRNELGKDIAAPVAGAWMLEGSSAPVAFGWDVAKSMNWTVGIGLDRDGRVVSFNRFRDNWESTINRMISVTNGVPAYFDSTGSGGGVEESLQRLNAFNFRGYKFSLTSKQQLMELLAVGIQQGRIWYPAGRIVEELMQFEYNITAKGNFTYSAPKGYKDDAVDSLAMAFKMFTENRHADLVQPIEFTRNSPWSI